MPKRMVKRLSFEEEAERKPLSWDQERRLLRMSLDRAPKDIAAWHGAVTELDRFHASPSAAMAAFLVDDPSLAREVAQQAIALAPRYAHSWNHGNAIHFGHTVLGLLALQDDQVAAAVQALHESGATPGSPQLNSFGPTMLLARELIRRQEHEAVLHYFEQCRRFWKTGSRWLDLWEKKLRRGVTPTFLMQLYR